MLQQDYSFLQIDDLINSNQLAIVRWIALAGQLLTVLIIYVGLGYELPLLATLGVILLSAVVNIGHLFYNRNRARMTNHETFVLLSFDTLQLFALLFLTGGLTNPFAVLLLAPVTVSASLLTLRYTFSLMIMVALLASVLSVYHLPLPWGGDTPHLPLLYLIGLWVALVLAVAFIGIYTGLLTSHARYVVRALSDARFNMAQEQQMLSLGSLATVAAHKLGSPLNSITLISHELEELLDENADRAELAKEIGALKIEADRCRQILAGLNEDANQIDQMSQDPVAAMALIQGLIDDRFTDIRDMIHLCSTGKREGPAPILSRRPDINHSLEMVIDNAAQFAATRVTIDVSWDKSNILIKVSDDGPGFKTAILNRLGQPYNSSRAGVNGHMGLGLFISSTMIEGLGGRLEVSNVKLGGAMVTFILPRASVDVGWKV